MRLVHVALISMLFPTVSQAIVAVRVEVECPVPVPQPPPVRLDVWLDSVPIDTGDDRLNRFVVKLDMVGASPDGVHFAGIEPSESAHPPVFPGVTFEDLGSDYDTIFVSASLPPGQGRDVTPINNGLFTAVVQFPPVYVPYPWYPVVIDPLHFGFVDSSGAPVNAVPGSPGGILCLPEPTAFTLPFLPAIAALRRVRARA